MTKLQELYLRRRSRSEQSDQRQANQAANISHQPRASPDSTSLASRIEFPTMTPQSNDYERRTVRRFIGLPRVQSRAVRPPLLLAVCPGQLRLSVSPGPSPVPWE